MKRNNDYDSRVLDAAERVLRRDGSSRLPLPDVARELGVPTLVLTFIGYRDAGLREEVIARKLNQIANHVTQVADLHQSATAEKCLSTFLDTLVRASRIFQREDPVLFQAYRSVSRDHSVVVFRFQRELIAQLEAIIAHGVQSHEFAACNPWQASCAALNSIAPFYDPRFDRDWSGPGEHGVYKHTRASIIQVLMRSTDAKSSHVHSLGNAERSPRLLLDPD